MSVSVLSFQQALSYDVFMTLLSVQAQAVDPSLVQFQSFCMVLPCNEQVNSYYYGYYVCSQSADYPAKRYLPLLTLMRMRGRSTHKHGPSSTSVEQSKQINIEHIK